MVHILAWWKSNCGFAIVELCCLKYNSILKSRDITLPTKVRLLKAMVFPVVMYGYESWIIKKAEGWRIDVFKIWCWKRFLKVPWTARSNQLILRETNPKYSLEELMLSWSSNIWPRYAKNKLIGKDCDAGKDWNQKEKGTAEDKMVGWHIDYMDINLSKLQ